MSFLRQVIVCSVLLSLSSIHLYALPKGPRSAKATEYHVSISSDAVCQKIFKSFRDAEVSKFSDEQVVSDQAVRVPDTLDLATFLCLDWRATIPRPQSRSRGEYGLKCPHGHVIRIAQGPDTQYKKKAICEVKFESAQIKVEAGLTSCLDIAATPKEWLGLECQTWVTAATERGQTSTSTNLPPTADLSWTSIDRSNRGVHLEKGVSSQDFVAQPGVRTYRACARNPAGQGNLILHFVSTVF